jgi:hypothetical protein
MGAHHVVFRHFYYIRFSQPKSCFLYKDKGKTQTLPHTKKQLLSKVLYLYKLWSVDGAIDISLYQNSFLGVV